MASQVGGLLVNLGLDVAQIKQDVGKANRELSSFRSKVDRQMGKAQRSFKRLTSGVQGLVAVLGAQQLGAAIGRSLSQLEEVNRQAESLGANVKTIQELQFAFRQFDLEQKDVTDALATISDRADDALSGMQSFVDDFERFGVEVDNLRGKDPGELFRIVAQRISELDSEQKQVTAAVRLFGDEVGQRLLPLIRQGADGLDDYANRAQEVGAVQSKELVKSSAQAAKEFRELREVIGARFTQAVANNAEELRDLADALTKVVSTASSATAAVTNFIQSAAKSLASEVHGIAADDLPRLNSELEKASDELQKLKEQRESGLGDQRGIDQRIEGQRKEVEQLRERVHLAKKLTKAEKERQEAQQQASSATVDVSTDSGDSSTSKDKSRESPIFDTFKEMRKEYNGWQRKSEETKNEVTNDLDEINREQKQVNAEIRRAGDIVADSLVELTREGNNARDVMQGLANDLKNLLLQKAASNIGQSIASGVAGGNGSSTQAMGRNDISSGATQTRASGGPVSQGESYVVGEKGPELFTPGKSGGITPNDQMGGGDVYNIDARGADAAAVQRLEQTIKAVNGSVERRAIQAVQNRNSRTGRR